MLLVASGPTGGERREPTRAVTGCESSRIDSRTRKSNTENTDDRSVLVNTKATKGGKNKYTCAFCLDATVDSTAQNQARIRSTVTVDVRVGSIVVVQVCLS